MSIKIINEHKFFTGKSSETSSEGHLVIDLERPSSAYEASASSLETSLDSSMERMLSMTTQLAAPRVVPQAECELKRICSEPRKIGTWPINKTSENLRQECFVDEDGHWAWKEDPNDQKICGHCGFVLHEHDRQVVNHPCWHRSHVECQREYKCHHWNKLVLYCVYKACRMPIVDDGDDLFNSDQMFFRELAPWRSMVTFKTLITMTHDQIRNLEAFLHNHRIMFGWKWDPTYLRHYRQPIQDEIRNIVIKADYMHDLPMSLNGVKERVNRRRFRNGTEFAYFANHELEKHPRHVWEMDFTEMTDIGFFGDYDTNQETKERVWKKVGRALLSGAHEVDFRNEYGIKIEFQSQRGFLKNFIVTNQGEVEPLEFDDQDDDDEGRQDGRPRYRPPVQNRFHEGELAAMEAQNEEHEEDLIQDELEHLENGDILERLLKASASTVDKVLDVWQEELENSIERMEAGLESSGEDMDTDKSMEDEKTFVVKKVMKDNATQTKSKGFKNKAVQAVDLPYDRRDSIVNFFEYDFCHRLMLAERGYYDTEQLKFILRYTESIPDLKEKIFGMMEVPKVLIPKLKGHIDLELATVSGFQIVHEGSFQFQSYEDPPLHPDVLQQGELYHGEDSSLYASSDQATKGSSSNASLGSSPGSTLKIVVHSTAKKVVEKFHGIFIYFRNRFNQFHSRAFGPSIETTLPPQTRSGGGSSSRSRALSIPLPFRSIKHWLMIGSTSITRRTYLLPWMNIGSKTLPRRMNPNNGSDKSPFELSAFQVTLLRYFSVIFKICDFEPIGYYCDSSSELSRNFFSQTTTKSNFAIILIKIYQKKRFFPSRLFSLCKDLKSHMFCGFFVKFKRRTTTSCGSSRPTIVRLFDRFFVSILTVILHIVVPLLLTNPFKHMCGGQFLTEQFPIWKNRPFQSQTTFLCTKQALYDVMTLLIEINAVTCEYSELEHHLRIMSKKIIAVFTVPDENPSKYRAAELCGLDIKFPQFQFEIKGSRAGNGYLKYYLFQGSKKSKNVLVLEVSKKDFNDMILPQLILLHVNIALMETFAFSTFPLGRHIDVRLPKWFQYHHDQFKKVHYPPWLARNGNLSVQIYNPPAMKKLDSLMRNATNFLMDTMASVNFVDGLEQQHIDILCNYPFFSEDAKTIAQKLVNRLPSANLGHFFGNMVLGLFRDLDSYYHGLNYRHAEIFDEIYAYGTIDDWKSGRINAETLQRLARQEIPNMERKMFEIATTKAISW